MDVKVHTMVISSYMMRLIRNGLKAILKMVIAKVEEENMTEMET